ncbi:MULTISPECIES: hypothetical protein [Burkholderiaceae]|nr:MULTISPECIES: hypothetical protein [Burkholderiaceae]SIT79945.1 hypothetical protein SAMN04487768_0357 [Burkholderia sp. b13]
MSLRIATIQRTIEHVRHLAEAAASFADPELSVLVDTTVQVQ